ncbi:MAG: membrane protein insertase YidC [Betaproteobacteria bacterium]|nr:membrane protein insertase YidC [Betaproteobacteria bacterium]
MDTQRLVALIVFSFSSLLLWDAWQKHNAPKQTAPQAQSQLAAPDKTQAGASALPTPSTSLTPPAPAKQGAEAARAVPGSSVATEANAGAVVVRTDTLEVEIGRKGGDIQRVTLLKHFAATDRSKPLTLMQPKSGHYFVTQTGLLGGLPNHNSMWTTTAERFEMRPGEGALEVRLRHAGQADAAVEKVYRFKPGSYVVEMVQEIRNASDAVITPSAYFQFLRDGNPPEGEAAQNNPMTGVATFTGPAVYTNEKKFVKVSFSDVEKGKQDHPVKATDGWLALVQHYFVSAWLPKPNVEREYFTRKVSDNLYGAGIIQSAGSIAPGQSATIPMSLYLGPQNQDTLKALAPGLDLVVDYGWLTILAAPLFWVLQFIHGFVGNWGWSIVLLTILIKAVFYPLNQKAGMSMAHMKAVAPRIQQLQQRYGDDRAKLNQAMMELYRTEKINPLGGCLPILIQIPVFIALYWVLLAAVELRHAPWAGWITDLSVPDPYYILPLVMAVSMFVQTKLNPPPPDPVQAKIMLFMPLIFSIFFFFFPAGLVLYWTVQNLIGIAQQWWINKVVEKQTNQKNAGKR